MVMIAKLDCKEVGWWVGSKAGLEFAILNISVLNMYSIAQKEN